MKYPLSAMSLSDQVDFDPSKSPKWNWRPFLFAIIGILILCLLPEAWADVRLPGQDSSDKLEAAGTLLRLVDTAIFKWGARVFAGLCIFSSAWSLKEQRFGIAIICIIGAVMFGTAPTWVRNLFSLGGAQSIFTYLKIMTEARYYV